MTLPRPAAAPSPLELPPPEPRERPDPWVREAWLRDPRFEVDAFLTGLRPDPA